MTTIYRKAGATQAVAIYTDESKESKILLVPVNRTYNQSKKPVYYLKAGFNGAKPVYITGLFETKNKAVFSGDKKNRTTGMKEMLKVTFENSGEILKIEGASLW